MRTWAIYYADGSVFGSDDGVWEDAPQDGVVCIVRSDGERREFISGGDFYRRFDDDGSIGSTADVNAWLRARCPWLKFGLYVSNRKHEAIMQRARDDWKD
jgi:hypothetical protein